MRNRLFVLFVRPLDKSCDAILNHIAFTSFHCEYTYIDKSTHPTHEQE